MKRAWFLNLTFVLVVLSIPSVSNAQKSKRLVSSKPPVVFVEQGACPFECCTYREWWALVPTPIYASPSSAAAPIQTLKKGERVKALTGFVRTRAGQFVVTHDHGRYRTGTTIWVYSYHGEGYFLVWYARKMYVEDLNFSPYGGGTGTRCQEGSGCWGHLTAEHKSEWWIKLRLRDGRIGWTNRGSDYANTDSCG
jgi:hypothetical protein